MKKYFLLIFFLISLNLGAQESFMSNYDSTQAGINHELLEACRGDYRKIGNDSVIILFFFLINTFKNYLGF